MIDRQPLSIQPVPRNRRSEALRLVFSRLPDEDAAAQIAEIERTAADVPWPWAGLFGAFLPLAGETDTMCAGVSREPDCLGRLVGAVFSRVQPGKTAAVWPPQTVDDAPDSTAGRLIAAANAWLISQRIIMAQSLLLPTADAEAVILREGGYDRLADLVYLVCLADEFPHAPPDTPLALYRYEPRDHQRLARLVETTYEQTLDCPTLNGLRTTDDVLAGYLATGDFTPDRWFLVRRQDKDVGCLLLADHRLHDAVELVYMGLAPAARGQGWGKTIARFAQWTTRETGRSRLLVAVDAQNGPAIRVYQGVGFQAWDRRTVLARFFSS
jgi:mycothiol synthase